jgi:hypothetical protein
LAVDWINMQVLAVVKSTLPLVVPFMVAPVTLGV